VVKFLLVLDHFGQARLFKKEMNNLIPNFYGDYEVLNDQYLQIKFCIDSKTPRRAQALFYIDSDLTHNFYVGQQRALNGKIYSGAALMQRISRPPSNEKEWNTILTEIRFYRFDEPHPGLSLSILKFFNDRNFAIFSIPDMLFKEQDLHTVPREW
jgi:hypothetical protein